MPTSTLNVRAFCRPNLSSQEILGVTEPWLNTTPIPTFETKDQYRAWCVNAGTDSLFFTLTEPEVPSMPVGNGNKPYRMHGFAVDFDATGLTADDFTKALQRCSQQFLPYCWNQTRSGGARFTWLFEEPVLYYGTAQWKRFVGRLKRELRVTGMLPGYDETCEPAGHWFTAGAGWTIHPLKPVIRATALHLWLADTSKDDDFDSQGIEIPIERVAAEVEKRFPNRWEGPFVLGARGVRFFDPTSDAKASIVRSNGLQCFTGPQPFMTWEAIFGREFVQKFIEDKLGRAISELWYDGKAFYRQLPSELFDAMDVSTTRRHLVVQYGLSPVPPKGETKSEVDMVLHRVETAKRVMAALPFPHNPARVVNFNRGEYLNTASARLWPASLDEQSWGENFPWTASYLSSLFATVEGLQAFLAWLHVWLKSLHEGSPRKGHAMFLVGPPGTGKTLLSTQIIARLVGGYAEATQYIVDGNQFNNAIFEYALLTVDDAIPGADPKTHARYSAMLKAVVANGTIRYNKKYGQSCDAPFDGRIMTSLNDDPNSLAIIPDADQSLLDKVILVRTGDLRADVADNIKERYATIDAEMGAFARWVLDYEIPEWIERDARFGIFPHGYHEADLLEDAKSVTAGSSVLEAVDMWRKQFKLIHSDQPAWEGTPTELYAAMRENNLCGHVIARINPVWLGRHVNQAIANKCPWLKRARRNEDKARIINITL